ncbi:MAG: beta strand repeat-containing protein [Anaerolineae bacterium]
MLNKQIASNAKRAFFWSLPLGIVTLFTLALTIPATLASPNAAPTVADFGPALNDTAVSVSANITATFTADPDPASVTYTTFAVHSPFYGLVTGTLSANTNQISLSPSADFKVGDHVQVIATAGITNTDGPLNPTKQWGFTTGRVADRCFYTFEDSGETLTNVAMGGGEWIDVDGDYDLDVVVTGQTGSGLATQISLNDGSGAFVDGGTADDALIAVQDGSLAVGDYNNDGHPDILLAGLASGFTRSIQLGRNNSGSMVDDAGAAVNLPGISLSAATWGDYDNDGDLDLLLSGQTDSAISKIYRNDAGVFVEVGAADDALPSVRDSAAAWGDYDDDGDLDLFISGQSTEGATTKLFRNDAGTFVDSGVSLPNVTSGSAAWADTDGDGDLDLAMSGFGSLGPETKIFENDGGAFTDSTNAFVGVQQSDMAFGDIDNDGDLDLVVIGRDTFGPLTAVYSNDGAGTFSPNTQAEQNLESVSQGSISFGDVDNDGDVDLLLTGLSDGNVAVSKIYTNENCEVSITAPASKVEGDTGNSTFTFIVNRAGNVDTEVSVDYTVSGGTADAADFGGALASGTITVTAGNAQEDLVINVSGDSEYEPDEDFTVTLSNPTSESILGTAAATGSIVNDDSQIHIKAISADKLEGDTGTTPFAFVITRTTDALATAVTVTYTVSGDVDGTDFVTPLTGSHTLASNDASDSFILDVQTDTDVEFNESFSVTLSNPTAGGEIGTAVANGVIQNDDGNIHIYPLDAVKAEGDSGNTQFTFDVVRSGTFTTTETVEYSVSGSGADAADAADFGGLFATNTLTFTPGSADITQTVTIDVSGDTTFEADEGFSVDLSNATGPLVIGIATANGTIQNDDTGLAITADDAVKAEGDSGTTDFTFNVIRSGNVSGANDVDYAVAVGSGTHFATGSDFGGPLPSGTISFASTETSKTITISVAADTTVEADEPFTVTLSAPTNNANILTGDANGTIENDDGTVSISPDGLSQAEGNSDTVTYTYSVELSAAALMTVTVDYDVSGTGADPANTTDFGGTFPSGSVSFGIGEATKQLEVAVSGDDTTEADETFAVTLSNMTGGYALATDTVTSTIENDDRSISISVDSAIKDEGDSGDTPFTFLISRTGLATGSVTADYAVILNNATADDFSGGVVPTGTVMLADGQMTTTLTININGDNSVEPNESFDVELSNPTGATLQTNRVSGVIQNDDSGYAISTVTTSQAEGDSGLTTFAFTVKRNGLAASNSSISYAVSGTGTNPADANDFGSFFDSGVLPFQAGQVDQEITISVGVEGDTQPEADETFIVTLSNPTGGEEISVATAVATILNDDDGIRISATPSEQSQPEGNSGTTSFDFTVDLIGTYSQIVTVDYAVNGSGVNRADNFDFDDNRFPAGTVTFAVGVNVQTLTIPVQADTMAEQDENFTITLSNVVGGAVLGENSIEGTIENDDGSLIATDIYLPMIMAPLPTAPDLVVDSISITNGAPTIVIRNIGDAAVTSDFWVDLYVNPPTVPTQVNDTIDTLQSDGMTWGIKAADSLLPLAPNEALTLTLTSNSIVTTTVTTIPSGATVYVQVDSAALGSNEGGVLEGHEINNEPYNNISSIINN